jgi:hypothetical protein
MTSYCKRCGAEIEWREINTRDGPKIHPFNVGTNISHFRTCPFAKEFMPNTPRRKRIEVDDVTWVRDNRTLDEYAR